MDQPRPGRVATLLREAREAKGLSVRALAAQIEKPNGEKIGGSYITDLEKGRGVPSPFVAERLIEVLGMNKKNFLAACDQDRAKR